MFGFSRFVVVCFLLLLNVVESKRIFDTRCERSEKPRDQESVAQQPARDKRFVLFPEFSGWLNDWRYLHHPKTVRYWISNYYPDRIDSNHVQFYIHRIISDINKVIGQKIVLVRQASSIDQANSHYTFFNYQICPTDDPSATKENVQTIEKMVIYPAHLISKFRYRAHGGIILKAEDNSTVSYTKYNVHHTFLFHQDFQYEPVIYECDAGEQHCSIDLYAVMLHETLHGFGIEHTERNLPVQGMLAVMHLYASRVMCHDDIRAIRKVYGLPVIRQNAKFDNTCRRDFPMNRLQRMMFLLQRWIVYGSLAALCLDIFTLILTIIYIRLRKCCLNRSQNDGTFSQHSGDSGKEYRKKPQVVNNAFLWHDDYYNT